MLYTGLYYYNARYYDPEIGRFIQPDTIIPDPADSQAYNRYAYCRNNPVMRVDPSGHISFEIPGTGIEIGSSGIELNDPTEAWEDLHYDVQEQVVQVVPDEIKPIVSGFCGLVAGRAFGAPIGGAVAGMVSSYLNGDRIQDNLFAAGVGAVSGALSMIPYVGCIAAGAFSGWAYAAYYGGDRTVAARNGAKVGAIMQVFAWATKKWYNNEGIEHDAARSAASGMAAGAAAAAINDEDIVQSMLEQAAISVATALVLNATGTGAYIDNLKKRWKFNRQLQSMTASNIMAGSVSAKGLFENRFKDFCKYLYEKSTAWHYENRDILNANLPNSPDGAVRQGGKLLSPEMSKYHDNGIGKPEQKYIFADGREAVYDGDTGSLIKYGPLRGTYNYVNPASPSLNPLDWPGIVGRGIGHFALDMVPYYIGGSDR